IVRLKEQVAGLTAERDKLMRLLDRPVRPFGFADKGLLTEAEYRKLLMCLHPDRSASNATLAEMLIKVQTFKRVLVKEPEAQMPEGSADLPRTAAEWAAAKAKATAARKAKRA